MLATVRALLTLAAQIAHDWTVVSELVSELASGVT